MATSLLSDRFSAHRFVDSAGFALPYRRLDPFTSRPITSLASPDPVPLVVLLHGAGERGDDNQAQLGNGAAELLATDERRAAFPCVYVLPQCPQGHRWVEVDWTAASHHLPPQPSQPLAALLALLDVLLTDSRIDARRIYLLGLSMGGFGVWDLLVSAAPAGGGGGDHLRRWR
jgi:predicted peptidase